MSSNEIDFKCCQKFAEENGIDIKEYVASDTITNHGKGWTNIPSGCIVANLYSPLQTYVWYNTNKNAADISTLTKDQFKVTSDMIQCNDSDEKMTKILYVKANKE